MNSSGPVARLLEIDGDLLVIKVRSSKRLTDAALKQFPRDNLWWYRTSGGVLRYKLLSRNAPSVSLDEEEFINWAKQIAHEIIAHLTTTLVTQHMPHPRTAQGKKPPYVHRSAEPRFTTPHLSTMR